MRFVKKTTYRVYPVWVKWIDASREGSSNMTKLSNVKPDVCRMSTVGFLVNETKKTIVLAQDVQPNCESCRDLVVIPKKAIKRIVELRRGKRLKHR